MIQIPIKLVILFIVVVHTALTHLINWGIREALDIEDFTAILLCVFMSLLEIILITILLCEMKLV